MKPHLIFLFGLLSNLAVAQPSSGPYGPQPQVYSVPAGRSAIFVAPQGDPTAPMGTLERPTTLEAAVARVVSGDIIVLRGGIYRTGNLRLNQGVSLQPYAAEQPVIKGSRVASDWKVQPNGLWKTKWPTLFPGKPADWWRREQEGRKTPLVRFNHDMVFVDGRRLKAVGWEGEVDEQSFYIDYAAGEIYLGVNPANRLVEVTAFDNAVTRTTGEAHGKSTDRKGLVLRGIKFTQYAFRALEIEGKDPEGVSPETEHGKDVVGTVLEYVTISDCSRVAAYLRGDRLIVRHCRISDTGTEGIFILSSSDVLVERNIFERNNVEQITGYYPAAVKIFNQCHRVTCRDNLVFDQPYSNGIWYDVGNVDAVFVNNWIERTLDGLFFEISKNVVCAGNVFIDCDKGVRSLNSAGVQVYHNTFVNTVASFERTERSAVGDHFGWHPRTGPDVDQREGHAVVGNLFLADASFPKAMLRFEQSPSLKTRLLRPQATAIDDNVYVRGPLSTASPPLIMWSPTSGNENLTPFGSPAALHAKIPGFESRSQKWEIDYRVMVRSAELRRFEPVRRPGADGVVPLTAPIRAATGWNDAARARRVFMVIRFRPSKPLNVRPRSHNAPGTDYCGTTGSASCGRRPSSCHRCRGYRRHPRWA